MLVTFQLSRLIQHRATPRREQLPSSDPASDQRLSEWSQSRSMNGESTSSLAASQIEHLVNKVWFALIGFSPAACLSSRTITYFKLGKREFLTLSLEKEAEWYVFLKYFLMFVHRWDWIKSSRPAVAIDHPHRPIHQHRLQPPTISRRSALPLYAVSQNSKTSYSLSLSQASNPGFFFNITWEGGRGQVLRDVEFFPWVLSFSLEF